MVIVIVHCFNALSDWRYTNAVFIEAMFHDRNNLLMTFYRLMYWKEQVGATWQ